MTMTQMNTRIDSDLKASGDAVLTRSGITPSEAIRALWSAMADTGKVPDFMSAGAYKHSTRQPHKQAIEGAGLALSLASEAGIFSQIDAESYDELREAAFEEQMLEDQERGYVR